MMAKSTPPPIVGTGVLIVRDRKVLFGHRKGKHGQGTWAPPGGKLDPWETLVENSIRETKEETGLDITNVRQAGVVTDNLFREEGIHSITVVMLADCQQGEPQLVEPDKFYAWEWVSWDDLPEPLFLSMQELKKLDYRPPGT